MHEFYGELYAALDAPIDDLGARMRSLGGPVDFRPSTQAERDALDEMDVAEMDGAATYTFLLGNYADVSARLYERIEAVGDDRPTQDLLIGLVFEIDKDLWMLRAHAGGTPE